MFSVCCVPILIHHFGRHHCLNPQDSDPKYHRSKTQIRMLSLFRIFHASTMMELNLPNLNAKQHLQILWHLHLWIPATLLPITLFLSRYQLFTVTCTCYVQVVVSDEMAENVPFKPLSQILFHHRPKATTKYLSHYKTVKNNNQKCTD